MPDSPSVADGIEHPLDPRVIPLGKIVGWIVTAVFSFILLIAIGTLLLAASSPGWLVWTAMCVWLGLSGLLAWWLQKWPEISYRYTFYRVDDRGFEVRRGVVWRKVIDVPRSRVQHTDVSQGPLERKFGLGTLIVHTAGTDHAMVSLEGLEHGTALAIRDHLLPRETDDAV